MQLRTCCYGFARVLACARKVVALALSRTILCLATLYSTTACSRDDAEAQRTTRGSRTDERIRHEREEESNATCAVLPLLPVLLLFFSLPLFLPLPRLPPALRRSRDVSTYEERSLPSFSRITF